MIVDDASPDGTGDLVEGIGRGDQSVRLIRRSGKLGLGSAYLEGFRYALHAVDPEVFISMDADFSHPAESVPHLVKALSEEADVAVGSRYIEGGGVGDWPWHRRLTSWGANTLVHVFLGIRITDATSGFRALNRKAVEALLEFNLSATGYAYQVESLYAFLHKGLRVREVPFVFRERATGKTKLSKSEIVQFAATVLRLWLRGLKRI